MLGAKITKVVVGLVPLSSIMCLFNEGKTTGKSKFNQRLTTAPTADAQDSLDGGLAIQKNLLFGIPN